MEAKIISVVVEAWDELNRKYVGEEYQVGQLIAEGTEERREVISIKHENGTTTIQTSLGLSIMYFKTISIAFEEGGKS